MKKLLMTIGTAAFAAAALPTFAATDIYGNEIKTYTEDGVQKTYQFWVSGTKAEIATKNGSGETTSSNASLATGTYSTPATEPISLEARFRTWLESIGTSIESSPLGFLLMVF